MDLIPLNETILNNISAEEMEKILKNETEIFEAPWCAYKVDAPWCAYKVGN